MGLLNNDAPGFESDDAPVTAADTAAAAPAAAAPAAAAPAAAAPAAAPAADAKATAKAAAQKPAAAPAAASTSTAVVKAPTNAVAASLASNLRQMESFKDALHVDYNTLAQLTAQQGMFLERETKAQLGDTVVFQLLSYQDAWVVSPEDDDAPDDVVRYSDDGKMCSDGVTTVEEHLSWLQANGFPKAKLKNRAVVVGAVESATKSDMFNGTLVQFDLSPASRVQWNRYLANAAYALGIGKYSAEQVSRVKASTSLAQGGGNNTFTLVKFEVAA